MSISVANHRIPPEIFDRARLKAAEERAKAFADFLPALGRTLRMKLRPRLRADVAFRFQNHGLWRGI
jgi:hypothetical protein